MSTFEVRVRGAIPSDLLEQLGHITTVQAAGTTLEVEVPDDAALWGIIEALRHAGVDLLEVRRHAPQSPSTPN